MSQSVLGFRRWRLDGYRLRSLNPVVPTHWQIGVNTAECLRSHRDAAASALRHHRPPGRACECGLYAFYEPDRGAPGATVSGAVLAWGRIEAHAHGFRAEHAEPVLLAFHADQPDRHIRAVRSIAAEFFLPVVEDAELAAAAASLGRPIAPELRPHSALANAAAT